MRRNIPMNWGGAMRRNIPMNGEEPCDATFP